MKTLRWLNLTLVLILLAACGRGNGPSTLPPAGISTTPAPSTEAAVEAYLEALEVEDYASMYALLTQDSRDAINEEDFAGRHSGAFNAMSVSGIEASLLSTLTNPQSAQAAFRIVYQTVLFGDIQRDFNLNLALEDGEWRLQWDDGLILPELAGGKTLQTNYTSPARGDIYDRNGLAIATQTDVYALGLVAGEVDDENAGTLFNRLWQLTGVRPEKIRFDYQNYPAGLYVPVGEASAQAVSRTGVLGFSGVQASPYTSRFYEPNAGPHVIGYTQAIFQEEVDLYRRLGYSSFEMVGKAGLEKWAEDYLRGRNAATLYIVAPDGSLENVLLQAGSQPAASIVTTVDMDFQQKAQAAMNGLPGAIVVMEVETGRVLAMVSSPGYDPNLFNPNNLNRQWGLEDMLNNPDQPTFNRAAQGQYPLGSVFKIITMAAGLESGVFTPETSYYCGYDFTDISGHVLHDWTWERCEEEKRLNGTDTCSGANAQPSGDLTLSQGLMRSCNPWFYHIGLELYNQGQGNLISDMARGFGLGRATGIEQVAETAGLIPNPADGLQATSVAIGQSDVQVTPLQVATFVAAIANGGTLYRPQVVEQILPVVGDPIQVFEPQAAGELPLEPENLQAIQAAMRSVVENPRGTAYARLGTYSIPTAGKTGTAEVGGGNRPHAWYAGYSLANRPDKPDIAVVVLVERIGEGSVYAAPIFRRVMEIYFTGQPGAIYPWESSYGVINPEFGQPAPTPTPGP